MGKILTGAALVFLGIAVGLTAFLTRYELHSIERGFVYRLDRWTGQLLLCISAACTPVQVLRPPSSAPVPAIPMTTTWRLEQHTLPGAPEVMASGFDSQAACKEALRLGKTHPESARWESYSCKPVMRVSTDPSGHWWVVLTENITFDSTKGEIDLETIFRPKEQLKAGSRWDGPYASKSICEAARLNRDGGHFERLACKWH